MPLYLHGAGRKERLSDSTEKWFVLGVLPEVHEVLDSRLDPMERGLWSACKSTLCKGEFEAAHLNGK